MTKPDGQDRMFVDAIDRGLNVLRAFRGHESLSLTEISRISGLTMGAAQRYVHTFEVLGYLVKDEGKRLRLAPGALEIGSIYLTSDPLIERANPHLAALNHSSKESVNLSRRVGDDMVFLARFTSHESSFIHMPIGTRVPMAASATGRAFLARIDPAEAEEIVHRTAGRAFTSRTLTDPGEILDRLAETRERGFASSSEEFYLGDLNIAAAVTGVDGHPVGCINISGPTSRWTLQTLEDHWAPSLIHTARAISSLAL